MEAMVDLAMSIARLAQWYLLVQPGHIEAVLDNNRKAVEAALKDAREYKSQLN
jgi:hypothetical protein